MSGLRRLERDIIKQKCYNKNGNTNNFKEEWNTYRTTKYGEALPVNTMPKKKHFLDKKDNVFAALRYQKMRIQEYFANFKKGEEVDNTPTEQ